MIIVGAVSLGCAKNRVDTETMLGLLGAAGYGIAADPREADLLLVNTCAFITAAQRESVKAVLEAARYKQEGRLKALLVTGCLPQRHGDVLMREVPEIDALLGTGVVAEVVRVVEEALEGKKPVAVGKPGFVNAAEPRLLTTPSYTAYLKIAEGCSNRCAFCLIPTLRGSHRSRRHDHILAEARSLADRGVKELVLVAQDTTRWGMDLYGRADLPRLLRQLAQLEGVRWVRVMYTNPAGITAELLAAVQEEEKICKYLDIPLQHVSPHVLTAMNRPVVDAVELVAAVRGAVPGITLRTTLMVGFPGETGADYAALERSAREIRFEHLGIFAYSREEGPAAAGFSDQVPWKTKRERAARLKRVAGELAVARNLSRVGGEVLVLTEGKRGRLYYGRGEGDAPEVDGGVYFTSPRPVKPGDFVRVRVTESRDYDVVGEAVEACSAR
jgi:ribosomal protein S12 methylthiotransferase